MSTLKRRRGTAFVPHARKRTPAPGDRKKLADHKNPTHAPAHGRSAIDLPPDAARERARRCLIYADMSAAYERGEGPGIDYRPSAVAAWPWRPTERDVDEWLAGLREAAAVSRRRELARREKRAASAAVA